MQKKSPLNLLDFLIDLDNKFQKIDNSIVFDFEASYRSGDSYFHSLSISFNEDENNFVIEHTRENYNGGDCSEEIIIFNKHQININDFINGKFLTDEIKNKKLITEFQENLIKEIDEISSKHYIKNYDHLSPENVFNKLENIIDQKIKKIDNSNNNNLTNTNHKI